MSATLSSVSEILRVGGWALRGVGYPFGVAERAVRLLAWTEAVGGGAVAGLRRDEPGIASSHASSRCERLGDAVSGRVMRAHGRHLLELGGPAVDLATHDGRNGKAGHVAIHEAAGLALLPALANLLAHRRLPSVIVYRAAIGEQMPPGLSPTGWLAVGVNAGKAEFHCGSDGEALAEALGQGSVGAGPVLSPELAAALERDVGAVRTQQPAGYAGILALPEGPGAKAVNDRIRRLPDVAAIDYAGRFEAALRDGVPMPAEDLKYLYDLEMRTWAPTSERSRGQAGYGVF